MKKNPAALGFTLIELLIVIALIGTVVIPLIFGIRQTGQTQNIRTSISVLSDDLQTAKVSAREARDKRGWGVISNSESTYLVMRGNKTVNSIASNRSLQNGVTFEGQFAVWFEIGTGNVSTPQIITVVNLNGQKYEVGVNELGTISITQK